jgi:GTP pyrophosphokinase
MTAGEGEQALRAARGVLASAAPLLRRLAGASRDRSAARPLIAAHRKHHPMADLNVLRRAYARAEQAHAGQLRKSGEPYVSHPLAVAMMLADLGMDTVTLAAALLHDTVEDTDYILGHLQAEFGREAAVLVDGVTKLDGSKWGDHAAAETFRKMILTSAADLRVLVIKLADRLHNLRTLGSHPQREKRERIARASQELLVPLAERLGIHVFKREMEDLCFAALQPEAFEAARRGVAQARGEQAAYLDRVARRLRGELRASGADARVRIWPRHLYSVHSGLRGRMDDLRAGDVCRLLVLVNGADLDCYVALGAVHGLWHPVAGRFRDFIALPKFNCYRALHTVVTCPDGQFLDVFIRTPAMHRLAEYGLIAQVADAATATDRAAVIRRTDLEWLRRLLAWQGGAASAEFMDGLRTELEPGGVVALTPHGKMIFLPGGATAIDFAYAVDTSLGNHAIGAVISGRLAALSTELADGQVVEILTGPAAAPSPDWLEFARTGQARVAVSQYLAEARAEQAAADGRRLLAAELADRGIDLLDAEADGTVLAIARQRGRRGLDALYAALLPDAAEPAAVAGEIAAAPHIERPEPP